jgi:hypothetical protein
MADFVSNGKGAMIFAALLSEVPSKSSSISDIIASSSAETCKVNEIKR